MPDFPLPVFPLPDPDAKGLIPQTPVPNGAL